MRRDTQTLTIDATQPLQLIDITNYLDNQFWMFCADEVMDENGKFLSDDELTYNRFEYGPDDILPAGTTVRLPYLWGFADTGLSAPTDYVMTVPEGSTTATVKHVVYVMLSQYHVELQKQDADARFYFVEQVKEGDDGVIEICLGT